MKLQNLESKYKIGAVLSLVAVLMIGLALTAYFSRKSTPGSSATPTPTVVKGNSTEGEPTPTATPSVTLAPGATATPAITAAPIAVSKPMLQKSSGNAPGSSVPAGAAIEFTCEDSAGLTCDLILTNVSSGQVVKLGQKLIADNGRGQAFASWVWNATRGMWTVTAQASNGAGASATSDPQNLEVK